MERETDTADLSTNEAAVSAVHPRHDDALGSGVSCACVLLPVTSPLKGHPNEPAHCVPFKCHAGVQETMLPYRGYFEWCHGVKVAALNYCRPFDAVYIPAVLSTHIIVLQIPDSGPDNTEQEHRQQRLALMIQHNIFFIWFLLCSNSCAVNVFIYFIFCSCPGTSMAM